MEHVLDLMRSWHPDARTPDLARDCIWWRRMPRTAQFTGLPCTAGLPCTLRDERMGQLEHVQSLEQHRKQVIPDVTHFLHCRRKKDLKLRRIIPWLKLGHALEGSPLFGYEGCWDDVIQDTAEFRLRLALATQDAAAARYT